MKAFIVVEEVRYCSDGYCWGTDHFNYFFKLKEAAERFLKITSDITDHEMYITEEEIDDNAPVEWLDHTQM